MLPERARKTDEYLEERGFWAVVYIRLEQYGPVLRGRPFRFSCSVLSPRIS